MQYNAVKSTNLRPDRIPILNSSFGCSPCFRLPGPGFYTPCPGICLLLGLHLLGSGLGLDQVLVVDGGGEDEFLTGLEGGPGPGPSPASSTHHRQGDPAGKPLLKQNQAVSSVAGRDGGRRVQCCCMVW